MTTGPQSQCSVCTHYRTPFDDPSHDDPFCAAFPDGIPDEVYNNGVDHRKPYPGDHGVRWSPDGDAEFPDYAMQEA